MTTTIDEVTDLFLTLQSDYRLTAIYQTSGSAALSNYLEAWLLYAINDFDNVCTQDLTYNTTTQSFAVDLSLENKLILAQLMIRYWLQKEVQDVLQMRLHIQDKDFKTFAEANNLKIKQDLYNLKREELSQKLTDYEIKHIEWADWKLQNFDPA